VFLLPAFSCFWFGGRQLARVSREFTLPATLLGFFLLQCLAFTISSAGFYFPSGKFANPSWAVMLERSPHHLPGYFMARFWYVLPFVALFRLYSHRTDGSQC
jgi:hypothetical protein